MENVSLEDLIKKEKKNFKRGPNAGRGGRFGNFRGGQRSEGNQVPRFRERAGIFKNKNRGEIVLPPRASQGGAGGEGQPRKRVSDSVVVRPSYCIGNVLD